MAIVPTIKVTFVQGGYTAFINVSDFDPQFHELYVDPAAEKAEKAELKKQIARAVDVTPAPVADVEAEAQATIDAEKAARRAASVAKAQAAAAVAREEKKKAKEAVASKVPAE